MDTFQNKLNNLEIEGNKVKLIPLSESHKKELLIAAADGKLWELWYTSVPSHKSIDVYINEAIQQRQKGTQYPFVVIDKKSNKIIGTTRYYNIEQEHRRLELGYTWYAKSYQRTGINTEVKYLLFTYAFETLNCIAVQLMTNWHNLPSRKAIERLGAKQDGVLRNHKLNTDGTYRDSVVFSITNQDWHGVKKSLKYELFK